MSRTTPMLTTGQSVSVSTSSVAPAYSALVTGPLALTCSRARPVRPRR